MWKNTHLLFVSHLGNPLTVLISNDFPSFLGEDCDSSKNGEAADENERKSSLDSLLGEVLEEITQCIFYLTAISSFKCSSNSFLRELSTFG